MKRSFELKVECSLSRQSRYESILTRVLREAISHFLMRPSIYRSVCPSVSPSVRPSVRPFSHSSVRPSICPSIHPFVHLPVRQSICHVRSSVHLSVRPLFCHIRSFLSKQLDSHFKSGKGCWNGLIMWECVTDVSL